MDDRIPTHAHPPSIGFSETAILYFFQKCKQQGENGMFFKIVSRI
ncbi:hypothetical protein HMPREF0762_01023 [Slackia exigua ATCC 700122]|uniref:Uncharacterized protein n=1 Tax=Slackia exigua (strain ATCC 700122 / DSM 15923 / CIP 105133 / JCM 11022 / KCTC 5966 / S-7) TaxID=649764 RepID=D0WGR8_SLAES|nr:hypothetical protein HMPREF0762_01023 [Slackia exigua ATCC 700122]